MYIFLDLLDESKCKSVQVQKMEYYCKIYGNTNIERRANTENYNISKSNFPELAVRC